MTRPAFLLTTVSTAAWLLLTTSAAALAQPSTAEPAAAAAWSTGPLVAYVQRPGESRLADMTPAKVVLNGPVGVLIAGALDGFDPAHTFNIPDPAGDMASEVAESFATSINGRVAVEPILDRRRVSKVTDLSARAAGADYVVEVDSPDMTSIYSPLHWDRYDLMLSSHMKIIRVSDQSVFMKSSCYIRRAYSPSEPSHGELIANGAAVLKELIRAKSHACVMRFLDDLRLPAAESFEPQVLAAAAAPLPSEPNEARPVQPVSLAAAEARASTDGPAVLAQAAAPPARPAAIRPHSIDDALAAPPPLMEAKAPRPAFASRDAAVAPVAQPTATESLKPSPSLIARYAVAQTVSASAWPRPSETGTRFQLVPYVPSHLSAAPARPALADTEEQGRVLELRVQSDRTVQEVRAGRSN